MASGPINGRQMHGASVATSCTDAPETALPGVLGQQESGRSDGQGRCGPGRARSWVRSGRPTGVLTRIPRLRSGTAVALGSKGVHLACNRAAAGFFSPPSAEVATGGSAVGGQNRKIGLRHPKHDFGALAFYNPSPKETIRPISTFGGFWGTFFSTQKSPCVLSQRLSSTHGE